MFVVDTAKRSAMAETCAVDPLVACVEAFSHDGAGGAVFVAFRVLDCEGDAGGFSEGFVDAAVLHC